VFHGVEMGWWAKIRWWPYLASRMKWIGDVLGGIISCLLRICVLHPWRCRGGFWWAVMSRVLGRGEDAVCKVRDAKNTCSLFCKVQESTAAGRIQDGVRQA